MPSSGDPSPFLLAGGPVAALLIHGFTGSPSEMRLLGDHLNRYGLTVLAPLLIARPRDPGRRPESETLEGVAGSSSAGLRGASLALRSGVCRR